MCRRTVLSQRLNLKTHLIIIVIIPLSLLLNNKTRIQIQPTSLGVLSLVENRGTARGRASLSVLCLPHSSAFVDGVVRRLWSRLQGLAGCFFRQVRGRPIFLFVFHDGLPVSVRVGLLAARQLQEGGQAVQVGHFVEGAQQEVHHHEADEQVDWREGQRDGGVTGGQLFNRTMC